MNERAQKMALIIIAIGSHKVANLSTTYLIREHDRNMKWMRRQNGEDKNEKIRVDWFQKCDQLNIDLHWSLSEEQQQNIDRHVFSW